MNIHLLSSLFFFTTTLAWLGPQKPIDVYQVSCFGVAKKLYEFQRKCPSQKPKKFSRGIACECHDYRFLETVVNCLSRVVPKYAGSSKKDFNISLKALEKVCNVSDYQILLDFAHNTTSLLPYSGDKTLLPGSWKVEDSFSLEDKEIEDALKVVKKTQMRERYGKKYGTILIVYWVGISFLAALTNMIDSLFPKLKLYMQSTRVGKLYQYYIDLSQWGNMTMPPLEFIMIGTFLTLCAVFQFVQTGVWFPDYSSLYNDAITYSRVLAIRAAVLSMYVLPLLLLFSGRNSILVWITGWQHSRVFLIHRWIARAEVCFVIIHSIAYTIIFVIKGNYRQAWSHWYWIWGAIGTIIGGLLCLQSLRWIRYCAYDAFIVLHIIGAAIFIAAGYWHVKLLGEPEAVFFYYACFAVWGLDRSLRILRILASSIASKSQSRRLLSLGVPTTVELQNRTLVVKFSAPRFWTTRFNPGRLVYIHFLTGWFFWQSHPFTIVQSGENCNEVRLYVRVYKGITKRLADLAAKSEVKTCGEPDKKDEVEVSPQFSIKALLDGPYGQGHHLDCYEELVCVAGGSGITAPFGYIQRVLQNSGSTKQSITLLWAVTTHQEKWFDNELKFLRSYKTVNLSIFYTREGVENSRENMIAKLADVLSHIRGSTAVICCGPTGLNNTVKRTVREGLRSTQHSVGYFEESFSF